MKPWLLEIVSTKNEGKSIIAERYFGTLKTQISSSMTVISKHVHINKLRKIGKQCNNIIYRTIIEKPVYVEPETYVKVLLEFNTQKMNLRTMII